MSYRFSRKALACSMRNFSARTVARAFLRAVAVAFVCLVGVQSSQAVLVQTNSTTSGDELAFPASATDLINQGQPSLGAVTHTDYANFSTFSINGLNDGQLGGASAQTAEATFDLDGTWTSEFNLNTLLPNTLGYTITEIRTISGWISDRVGQQYTVEYSLINNPAFSTLGSFNLFTNITGSAQISLTDTTGVLLSGVDAIRFSFVDPATGDTTVYREVDVFGFEATVPPPPVPEPASVVLLGLGCVGLMVRRHRRRA